MRGEASGYKAALTNAARKLYTLNSIGNGNATQQVQAAIQVAVQDYLNYLKCAKKVTGATPMRAGRESGCPLFRDADGQAYTWLFDKQDDDD